MEEKYKNIVIPEKFRGQTSLDDSFLSLETPFEFFKYFVTDDLIEHISKETKRYMSQKDGSKPIEIDRYDIMKYFGILVFLTIMQCSNFRYYWNNSIGHPSIISAMPVNKFEKIREFLYFTNNINQKSRTEPGFDPLFKIRPVIESTRQKFLTVPMEERLAVDEQMCATKCHHRLKVYMPDKPHPYGFKFFVLSGVSGFAFDYEIYAGPVDMTDKEIRLQGEKDLGSSSNVVVRLARHIPRNCFYKLYFDNYYTSLPLMIYLQKLGIYSLGTVRRPRVVNCKIPTDKKSRGTTNEYVAKYDGCTLWNVSWMDNKEVMLLSSFVGAEPHHKVRRYNRREKKHEELDCPNIIVDYNRYMGGFDSLDANLGRYKIKLKSRKFYLRIFYHILDLCVINAWTLQRRVLKQKNRDLSRLPSLSDFRIELSAALM